MNQQAEFQGKKAGDIQITTGGYSLRKTNDMEESLLVKNYAANNLGSGAKAYQTNPILVQNNGVTVEQN